MSNRKNSEEEEIKVPDERQEQWESLDESEEFDKSEEFEEFDEFEEFEDEPEDPEENVRLSPKKIAVFGGLFVLAVLICIPLWMLTHKKMGQEAGSEPGQSLVQETQSGAELLTQEPEVTQPPAATQGPAATDEPAVTQPPANTPETNNTPAPLGTPAPVGTTAPAGSAAELDEPISGNADTGFIPAQDSVTAKDVTNLRSAPSTEDSENVVGQLQNGEVLSRTGLDSDAGWSRLEYNGQTVYAVTRYLTTDLTYKPPVTASDPNRITTLEGRIIIFTDCDDYITPKEYVNLRTEPSTSQGDTTVRCQVRNGESVHRTGYSPDSGWSRVDYNGETLYVVTNYVVSAPTE